MRRSGVRFPSAPPPYAFGLPTPPKQPLRLRRPGGWQATRRRLGVGVSAEAPACAKPELRFGEGRLAQADGDPSRLRVAARAEQGQRGRRRSRLHLEALHVLVAEPEMVPDLVDQHVADDVGEVLAGRQPIELTAKRLKRTRDLPVSWAEQRRVLGFA